MSILLSDELELRRQLEQIEWAESFLKLQQVILFFFLFFSSFPFSFKIKKLNVEIIAVYSGVQEVLPPVEFLAAWSRHNQYRSLVLHNSTFSPRAESDVKADIWYGIW